MGGGTISNVGSTQHSGQSNNGRIGVSIGVFFDGTLNNRENTNHRMNNTEMYRDITLSFLHGSYENDHSNISRMEPFYERIDNTNFKQFSIYIEGIGTENSGRDHFRAGTMGISSTGIVNKVERACEEIGNKLRTLSINRIENLVIDTFGFSRGAAAARHFVHQIYSSNRGLLGSEISDIYVGAIHVRFVGLYDTVAAFGPPSNHENNTGQLGLDSIRRAQHTFQLAADDEHRKHFKLTNIDSAVNRNRGVEKFLPGVHSDIGGGYADNQEETVVLENHRSRNLLIAERDVLMENGWYLSPEIQMRGRRLIGTRNNLRKQYSYIPLFLMVKYANRNGHVPGFDNTWRGVLRAYSIRIQGDREETRLLHRTKRRLDDYVFDRLGLHPPMRYDRDFDEDREDQRPEQDSVDPLLEQDRVYLKKLRNRFFHFSANYAVTGMNPDPRREILNGYNLLRRERDTFYG